MRIQSQTPLLQIQRMRPERWWVSIKDSTKWYIMNIFVHNNRRLIRISLSSASTQLYYWCPAEISTKNTLEEEFSNRHSSTLSFQREDTIMLWNEGNCYRLRCKETLNSMSPAYHQFLTPSSPCHTLAPFVLTPFFPYHHPNSDKTLSW